jgi:hypothetical protein
MIRSHILLSDIPILQDTTVTAACGESVPNVQALHVFDEENPVLNEDSVRRFGECQKCKAIVQPKRYRYTICNGQEIRTGEE